MHTTIFLYYNLCTIKYLSFCITAITRVGGNRKGIFTRQRQPKCAAHLVRIRYFQLAKFLNKAESPPDLLTYTFSEKGHSEL